MPQLDDPHPFFSVISEAKANSARYWPSLPQIESAIREGVAKPIRADRDLPEAASTFLAKMFRDDDLNALVGSRRALEDVGLADNPLAILILSRMLDHCCFAATDGIYKAPTSTKKALAPDASLDRVIGMLRSDRLEARSCNRTKCFLQIFRSYVGTERRFDRHRCYFATILKQFRLRRNDTNVLILLGHRRVVG